MEKCYVEVKVPRMDKDGCWEFENTQDESAQYWSTLSSEENVLLTSRLGN